MNRTCNLGYFEMLKSEVTGFSLKDHEAVICNLIVHYHSADEHTCWRGGKLNMYTWEKEETGC
jgi:hypothetical protein